MCLVIVTVITYHLRVFVFFFLVLAFSSLPSVWIVFLQFASRQVSGLRYSLMFVYLLRSLHTGAYRFVEQGHFLSLSLTRPVHKPLQSPTKG